MVQALRAGKHVYSAVPMAITAAEIAAIIDAVKETGLTYMMGETSHYNPATVYARNKIAEGAFGRLFYAEGDYVHDMDLGFYDAYQYSGGEDWKATASYPPLLYPTHSVGGVLGAWQTHAVSVSAIGVRRRPRRRRLRQGGQPVRQRLLQRDRAVRAGRRRRSFRTNEFRRVGYPSHIRESRFRFFGTEASFEQLATVSRLAGQGGRHRRHEPCCTRPTMSPDDPSLADVAPALRDAFISGSRRCTTARLPPSSAVLQRARGQPPLPGRRLRHAPSTTGRSRR